MSKPKMDKGDRVPATVEREPFDELLARMLQAPPLPASEIKTARTKPKPKPRKSAKKKATSRAR